MATIHIIIDIITLTNPIVFRWKPSASLERTELKLARAETPLT